MSDQQPLIGIVLVNYNGSKFLPECLETLRNQTYQRFKIVLVDNMSTDGSREYIAALPDDIEKVLLDRNTGITGGNNAGMKRSQEIGCDFILLLNNDTEAEPGFLAELVNQVEPNCLLVPKIFFFSDRHIINNSFGNFDYVLGRSQHYFYGLQDSERSQSVQYGTMASTCALMIPTAALEKIGLMDDEFFIYYDDTDFVVRAVRAGYRIKFVPESVLFHKESMSSGGNRLGPLPLYYLTRNRIYLMRKHANAVWFPLFLCYFWVVQWAKLVVFRMRGNRAAVRAISAALRDYRHGRLGYAEPSVYRNDIG